MCRSMEEHLRLDSRLEVPVERPRLLHEGPLPASSLTRFDGFLDPVALLSASKQASKRVGKVSGSR